MPRRKPTKQLTLHQRDRIRSIRERREVEFEVRRKQVLETLDGLDLGPHEEGLVIAHFGLNVEVEEASGQRRRCAIREMTGLEPVCGDRVVWQRCGNDQGVISTVLTRKSVLTRPSPYGRLLTVAANVDRIMITTTATDLNRGLLDRYLVAAEAAEIEPILVINKIDLIDDISALQKALQPYAAMNYSMVLVSVYANKGMQELDTLLSKGTSVFVGQSGVGKSSLIANWVHEEPPPQTAEVNPDTGKGRHTTTVARLYHLAQGGNLIDSPGIREFGLYGIEQQAVAGFFRDILPFIGQCRFANCSHSHEPHCAVQAAVKTGHIAPERFASLQRIQSSLG